MSRSTTVTKSRYTDSSGKKRVQVLVNGSPVHIAHLQDEEGERLAHEVVLRIERRLTEGRKHHKIESWDGDTQTRITIREWPT